MEKEPLTSSRSTSEQTRKHVILCAQTAAEHRGYDILVLDVRRLTDITDYLLIATGTSRRQIHTMADEIDRLMEEQGEYKLGIEGYDESRWVLIDYGDFVVHLFDLQTRKYYDLESLWGDATRIEWDEQQQQFQGRRK